MSSEKREVCNTGNNGAGFSLIVVLFILLIIVGAAFLGNGYDGGYCC